MNKLVSIIMPVYNGALYIDEAIDSVINQSYSNLQLIIVNDGSTDKTHEILDKYQNNPLIRIIEYKDNKGKVYAINKGVAVAKGYYFILLAADDVLTEDSVKKRVESLVDCSFSFCNSWKCDKNLNISSKVYNYKQSIFKWNEIYKSILWQNTVGGGTSIFTSDLAKHIFPIPESLRFEDWWITFFALLYTTKICYIDEPLIMYRIHENNDNGILSYRDISKAIKKDYIRHYTFYEEVKKKINEMELDNRDVIIDLININQAVKSDIVQDKFIKFNKKFVQTYGFKQFIIVNLISKNLHKYAFFFKHPLKYLKS